MSEKSQAAAGVLTTVHSPLTAHPLTSCPVAEKLSPARIGAPPVRGKGAGSHPNWFADNTNLHSGLQLSGLQAETEGRSMPRTITPATSLDNLRKEAKRWLRDLHAADFEARARFVRAWPKGPAQPVLRDVQHALAVEYGFENWNALKQALAARATSSGSAADPAHYDRLADDYVLAYATGDAPALQRLNQHYARSYTWDDLRAEVRRRVYAVRQAHSQRRNAFDLNQARTLIARTS